LQPFILLILIGLFMKIKTTILCFIILLASVHNTFGQQVFRRHFIILQDNSGSFYHSVNETPIRKVQEGLIQLFENKMFNNDYNNLLEEKKNGVKFFDTERDEVSFFWFVAGQYDNIEFRDRQNGSYNFFLDYFIKEGNLASFRSTGLSISDFLYKNFTSRQPAKTSNQTYLNGLGTYSFTAYAYPCVLDVLKTDYSSEYIVIIISDFKAGSTFGNRQDEDIMRQAFREKADNVLKRVNWLNGQFYKIDYFDYYQKALYGLLGMTAFKIKPNAGFYSPENVNLRINSDIDFTQKEFSGNEFTLNPTSIVFEHNNKLKVRDVIVEISGVSDNTIKKNVSAYIEDANTMTYRILPTDIVIDGLTNKEQAIEAGQIKYIFQVDYSLDNDSPLKFTYELSRSIDISNFKFLTQLSTSQIITMTILLFLLVTAIIVFILFRLGKPTGILLEWSRFTDSYESTDFSENGKGRILTDYMNWTEINEENGEFQIKVRGRFDYRNRKRFYNWEKHTGFPIAITPLILDTPEGFSTQVEVEGAGVSKSPDQTIRYEKPFYDGIFEFIIRFKKENYVKVTDPLYFAFKVEVEAVNNGIRSFRISDSNQLYEFHIGPDLGTVWVGMDPGTTGSCIATATNNSDLVIEQEGGEDKITPSEITIDPDKIRGQSDEDIRNACYFGAEAAARWQSKASMFHFVSIKKLIGYSDKTTLKDGVEVDGILLSSLLIEAIYKEHEKYISKIKSDNPQFFENNEKYKPQRLAITIPNNFTATKIQHLKQSIEKNPTIKFREIRFIYEAEAVLVHYINQINTNIEKQSSKEGETIFVYDMGGATINATLANIKRRQNKKGDWIDYITIISKLGYGIGGDTIDYALIKWIYSKDNSYRQLVSNNPFRTENVNINELHNLKSEAFKLKFDAFLNTNNKDSKHLISREYIEKFYGLNLKKVVDENGDILIDDDPFEKQCLKGSDSFLYDPIFEEYIWNNIESIVDDILFLCEEKKITTIDTVIMSGRSSHFPRVRETVENTIKSTFKPRFIQLNMAESKSAIAKGACLYGTQNKSIILKNQTTSGVYGVIQKIERVGPANFLKLIDAGEDFEKDSISNTIAITRQKDFEFDGKKVCFCQVMGVNPDKIIANNERHKYSDIAILPAKPRDIEQVSLEITNKDKIFCTTWNSEGEPNSKASEVKDAEITKCNDEHYYFFLKKNK